MFGDGQPLRNTLEGTWLNAASYSLAQIQQNIAALTGGQAKLNQAGTAANDIRIKAVVRVPASQVNEYFTLPVDRALDLASELSPEMAQALSSGQPLLIIETCGWRHPAEGNEPGTSDTSASVYLVVLAE
jgi:hypothetical protein